MGWSIWGWIAWIAVGAAFLWRMSRGDPDTRGDVFTNWQDDEPAPARTADDPAVSAVAPEHLGEPTAAELPSLR